MALADTVKTATILLLESNFAHKRAPAAGLPLAEAEFTAAQFIQATADAAKLESLQGRLRNYAERQCNGYSGGYRGAAYPTQAMADEAEARDEAQAEKLRGKALAILSPYGVKAHFNRDPRGSAIKLATPKSGQYNTFGGAETGWAV